MKLHFPTLISIIISLSAIPSNNAHAQSRVDIVNHQVSYLFGHHVAFEAEIETEGSIQSIEIYFKQGESNRTSIIPAKIDEDHRILGVYEFSHGTPLLAFSKVTYWFRVLLEFQDPFESPHYDFEYKDNRFEWNELISSPFTIYTFRGDQAFAAQIAAAAHLANQHSENIFGPNNVSPIDIYVYGQSQDLQYALNLLETSWIAGHANPTFGVVLVSIQSGELQNLEITRQVPHEITHLLLYQAYPTYFEQLPLWLNEGYASLAESNTFADYQHTVEQAAQSGNLMLLSELCTSFPSSAARASLAYAQSTSFVSYLLDNYGAEMFNQLIEAYAAGQNCNTTSIDILGVNLSELEQQWKLSLNPTPSQINTASTLLPLGILFLFTLIALAAVRIINRPKINSGNPDGNKHDR